MTGKVYFITGGNRGIGYELVKQLAEQDSSNLVIATTRDPSRSKELKALSESNKNVKIISLDVSDEDSINKLDTQLKDHSIDGIDVLISNAGIADPSSYTPVIEASRDIWVKHYLTNVVGPISITQKLFPYLEKKDTKKIIWISSVVGSISGVSASPVSQSAYGQSKAALNFTLRTLSAELAPKGYTSVVVHPGFVKSELGLEGISIINKKHPGFMDSIPAELLLTTEESAKLQIELFNELTKEDNGKFLSYTGDVVPW